MFKSTKELEAAGYKEHHVSWCRGYLSRKNDRPIIYPYKGRFGEGYCVETPSCASTRYHYITYFVK